MVFRNNLVRTISIFVLISILFQGISLFAQETIPGFSADSLNLAISEAIDTGNFKKISFVLRSAKKTELPAMEAIVVKIAQNYLDASNFDLSSQFVDTVLQNNIDNTDAQKLLIQIGDGKRDFAMKESLRLEIEKEAKLEAERLENARQEALRVEAERLEKIRLENVRLENERLLAEKLEADRIEKERLEAERLERARLEAVRAEQARFEAIRVEDERLEAERLSKLAERKPNEVFGGTYSAALDFSPLEFVVGSSSFYDAFYETRATQAKYGFHLGLEGRFMHPYYNVLFHTSFDILPWVITGSEMKKVASVRASVGSPLVAIPFFVNVGYKYFEYTSTNSDPITTYLFSNVGIVTLGVGIENFKINDRFDISGRAIWLPMSTIDSLVLFAMDFDVSVQYSIMKINSVYTLYTSAGSVTTMIVAKGGSEYSEAAYISIGVKLYD